MNKEAIQDRITTLKVLFEDSKMERENKETILK